MKKYDLHIHTVFSPCSMNKPEVILKKAKKAGLDGIAITDHNCIKGALKIKAMNKDKSFEVIVGEEIRTDHGEVLALYLKKNITSRDFFKVIDQIRAQDGIIIIPHPYRCVPWLRFKLPIKEVEDKIDGIEVFNSRNIAWGNIQARHQMKKLKLAEIGSSDAHLPIDIGKGYTLFEGDLRTAIKNRKTSAFGTTRYGLLSDVMAGINKRVLCPLKVKKKWT